MAEGSIGPSERIVRPAQGVERAGSATDRRPRPRREQQDQQDAADRRRKEPPNPRRRRVYDMLFDEVDRIGGLDDRQRARIKENIRSHVANAPPPPDDAPPPDTHDPPSEGEHEEEQAERLLSDPQAELPLGPDHIVQAAAPVHPHQPISMAEENRLLAEQLRLCLAQHTERARKIAVYLHLLLRLRDPLRPTLVLDV